MRLFVSYAHEDLKKVRVAGLFLTGVLFTGLSPATAQDASIEFEVVDIDRQGWVVTARAVGSGEELRFRLPPAAFVGKAFDADLSRAKAGDRFSAKGAANARVRAERTLGWQGKEKGGGKPGRTGGEGSGGYRVAQVKSTGDGFEVVARGRGGEQVRFLLDPASLRGYRFHVDPAQVSKGAGFELIAPNREPLRNCCRLLSTDG